jgi:hypothetical protein
MTKRFCGVSKKESHHRSHTEAHRGKAEGCMRNDEYGMKSKSLLFIIPHSSFTIPHLASVRLCVTAVAKLSPVLY